LGDRVAQFELGMAYFLGEGVEENRAEGWKWLLQSAQQDYVEAEYQVGICYEHGWAVEQNFDMALVWFEQAAKKKHTPSIRNLGFFYLSDTPKKDPKKAAAWFRKAVTAMSKDALQGRSYLGSLVSPQCELAFA
jgi:TPR repeat protein